MKSTTTVFAQLIKLLPREVLEEIAHKYYKPGNATKFTIWDQLVALVFCHISGCDSLREIEDGLYSALGALQHAGGAKPIKRTSLAYANSQRDYKIFQEFYEAILKRFSKEFDLQFGEPYQQPTYAIDSTTITLCMSLFPWAKYTSTKGGIKLHTVLEMRSELPCVMDMTHARVHDSKATRQLIDRLPPMSVVVMDRGYNDYELFEYLCNRETTFVTRLKENTKTSPLQAVDVDPQKQWGVYKFHFSSEAGKAACGDRKFHLVQWHDATSGRWFVSTLSGCIE